MKEHSSEFKENLINIGREVDNIITYDEITLHDELYKVDIVYEGGILKSVMKELDIESSVDIPKGTILNYQMGIKVDNSYEYLDYGNYVVYSSERQEDERNYKIVCYDKLLYSMVDYEDVGVQYPITIRDYIIAICNKLGIEFANAEDEFANYDRQILSERYLTTEGESLEYTFRDVFDELAEVTASTICINKDDKLEIRYIEEVPTTSGTAEGTNIELNDSIEHKIKGYELESVECQQENVILPSEYQQVEYIESTGEQCIDTGVTITPNLNIDIDFAYMGTTGSDTWLPLYGARISGTRRFVIFIKQTNNKMTINYAATDTGDNSQVILEIGKKYNLRNVQGKFYLNGEYQSTMSTTSIQTTDGTNYSMYLFGMNAAGSIQTRLIQAKIYKCKMYEGNDLIRYLIPCYRKSDNVIGMYDLVNNVFYINARTGAFTKGSNVDVPNPDYPQDIKVVKSEQKIDVHSKNIFDVHDKRTGYWANDITIDDEDYIIFDVDNTNGSSIMFKNFWTNPSDLIEPSTIYTCVVELKDIEMTGNGRIFLCSDNPNNSSQIQTNFYIDSNFLQTPRALKITSKSDISNKTTMLRSYIQANAGGKIKGKVRISFIKGDVTGNIPSYVPFDRQIKTIDLCSKNLNFTPYTNGTSLTRNGITFSVDNEGIITANGTATGNAYFYCHTQEDTNSLNLSKDTYTLTGCPSGRWKFNLCDRYGTI